MTDAQTEDEIGHALPLILPDRLDQVLITEESPLLRSKEEIFKKDCAGKQERDLYKRFCWWRKPVMLWIQRAYVHRMFDKDKDFTGMTDEDAVPYDYDHLCPQNHWGADWRNINKATLGDELQKKFRDNRSDVGNCIGNMHVLDSSLNRSFGECSLEEKLKSTEWSSYDSRLYDIPRYRELWCIASPSSNKIEDLTWDEKRLRAFQTAVYRRAFDLYRQYFYGCSRIIS